MNKKFLEQWSYISAMSFYVNGYTSSLPNVTPIMLYRVLYKAPKTSFLISQILTITISSNVIGGLTPQFFTNKSIGLYLNNVIDQIGILKWFELIRITIVMAYHFLGLDIRYKPKYPGISGPRKSQIDCYLRSTICRGQTISLQKISQQREVTFIQQFVQLTHA